MNSIYCMKTGCWELATHYLDDGDGYCDECYAELMREKQAEAEYQKSKEEDLTHLEWLLIFGK